MTSTSSTVWITGARGFIGQTLAAHCARNGRMICGLGHGAWPPTEAARTGMRHWLNGDVTGSNLQALWKIAGAPEVIYHLAGGSSVGAALAQPGEDFSRTVASTAALLEWVRLAAPATRLVLASSAAVYGDRYSGAINEQMVPHPMSPYGFHKLMMEDLCRSYAANYGIAILVARLFSVYGAGLRKQLLWDLCSRLAAGNADIELGGNGQEMRDWVDVTDAADVLIRVADLANREVPVLNIGTGTGISVRAVAELIISIWLESGSPERSLAFSGVSRRGDPRSLVADVSLLKSLGLACTTNVGSGMRRYVAWYRASAGKMS